MVHFVDFDFEFMYDNKTHEDDTVQNFEARIWKHHESERGRRGGKV